MKCQGVCGRHKDNTGLRAQDGAGPAQRGRRLRSKDAKREPRELDRKLDKIMSCCPPGSLPGLTVDYTPRGEIVAFEGLNLYVTGAGDKALIGVYDIFGA